MKKFLRSSLYFIIEAFFLVLCAYIASLAFPGPVSDTGISWIAFFSLIPVFVVINRTSWIHAPFLGFIYGFMFFIFYNYWLSTFHPLAILIAPILKGVQYIPLFLCLKACCALFRKRSYLVQALVYTAYLYLTQQGFIGYPYGNLSSAVTPYLVLFQIADVTGIWGPAFLMTVSQTLAARMVTDRTFRSWFSDAMWITACWLMIIIYGLFAIWRYDSAVPDRTVRASVSYIPMLGRYTDQGIGVVDVELLIEDPPEGIMPGFTFEGTMAAESEVSMLLIPQNAITRGRGGSETVDVKRSDGSTETVSIRTKYLGEGLSELLSGDVSEGDVLIVRSSGRSMMMDAPPAPPGGPR